MMRIELTTIIYKESIIDHTHDHQSRDTLTKH